MNIRILSTAFIVCTLLLAPLEEAFAEANVVPLKTIMESGSLQAESIRISPESIAALMQRIHYKKEGLLTSSQAKKLFSNYEAVELSKEIAPLALSLQSGQAIAFVSDMERVKGYLLFSNHQIIWYISSIDGRPSERITHLAEEYTTLDDSDSSWENIIEESYWKLSPQKDQSLYQNRPDWLLVPVRHTAVEKQVGKSEPASLKARSENRDDRDKLWSRIETLHGLADKGFITPAEYNSKILEIIAEQKQAYPGIDEQMELLHRFYQKKWIEESLYQSRKRALLKSL